MRMRVQHLTRLNPHSQNPTTPAMDNLTCLGHCHAKPVARREQSCNQHGQDLSDEQLGERRTCSEQECRKACMNDALYAWEATCCRFAYVFAWQAQSERRDGTKSGITRSSQAN